MTTEIYRAPIISDNDRLRILRINKIFKARCKQLVHAFKQGEKMNYLVGDSTLYHANNVTHLSELKFITRIPGLIKKKKKRLMQ